MLGEERTSEDPSLAPSNADSAVYDDGYLRVEHGKFYVACAGKPLYNLTRKEFLILSLLVRAMGRPVTKQEIWGHAWEGDAKFNRDTLRVHVATLRRKLSTFGLDIVAVVHVGYRLISSAVRAEGDVP
jgi:DNA-binding response OmpR family regulator